MTDRANVLVTGGAGYIGSHTLVELLSEGHEALVIDNHSNSHEEALVRVKQLSDKDFGFVEGDIRDPVVLDNVFLHQCYFFSNILLKDLLI